jgi:hypothetical protein
MGLMRFFLTYALLCYPEMWIYVTRLLKHDFWIIHDYKPNLEEKVAVYRAL